MTASGRRNQRVETPLQEMELDPLDCLSMYSTGFTVETVETDCLRLRRTERPPPKPGDPQARDHESGGQSWSMAQLPHPYSRFGNTIPSTHAKAWRDAFNGMRRGASQPGWAPEEDGFFYYGSPQGVTTSSLKTASVRPTQRAPLVQPEPSSLSGNPRTQHTGCPAARPIQRPMPPGRANSQGQKPWEVVDGASLHPAVAAMASAVTA